MTIDEDILAELTPSESEQKAMAVRVAALEAGCNDALAQTGLTGRASVQGSIAKQTWLAGDADIDCFLLMEPETSQEKLNEATEAAAAAVLGDVRRKYAQHPYVIGTFDGAEVDLVPAYAVAEAGLKMSAVDRTPFHTEWVLANLDESARSQVRLLKKWCKGVGIYGAETSTGGFSGYLLEVLIARFKSFQGVLEWFAADAKPRRITLGDDQVDDTVSALIVVDPVDASRNCAAAVQDSILALAAEAAHAYHQSPAREFFHPAPPRVEPAEVLQQSLAQQEAAWIGLAITPATDRLDIVFPQFQKAARTITAELERAGFTVIRSRADPYDDEKQVGLQWIVGSGMLPAERIHVGPKADRQPNAQKFMDKWQPHPDRIGEFDNVDGKIAVRLRINERTPRDWLAANLARLPLGKHVMAAIKGNDKVLVEPAEVDGGWATTVADTVLERRPWQR